MVFNQENRYESLLHVVIRFFDVGPVMGVMGCYLSNIITEKKDLLVGCGCVSLSIFHEKAHEIFHPGRGLHGT